MSRNAWIATIAFAGAAVLAAMYFPGVFASDSGSTALEGTTTTTEVVEGSKYVMELTVGDCFIESKVSEDEIGDVVNCSEPHNLEVYATFEYAADADSPYPADGGFHFWLVDQCYGAFEPFVGTLYGESAILYRTIEPVGEEWAASERTGICLLYEFDDAGDLAVVERTARDSKR